jgi:hypothetical protein
MTDSHIELTYSPLMRTHSAEGHTLQIQIYRSADSPRPTRRRWKPRSWPLNKRASAHRGNALH